MKYNLIHHQFPSDTSEQGFTIIELMIATSVLTVILLIVTVTISGIGTLYYKGVTLSSTQDSTRSIADQLTQDIQLNDKQPIAGTPTSYGSTTVEAYCIGTVRYSFIVGKQIGPDATAPALQINHVLWRDHISAGAACVGVDLTQDPIPSATTMDGRELIGPRSRLTFLSINNTGSNPDLFTIQLGVAYGDSDLINLNGLTSSCNGSKGFQFCATDSLTTSAIARVSGG
jgi:prepilin-type N-terminal cleavage/methylation domain-containing protein